MSKNKGILILLVSIVILFTSCSVFDFKGFDFDEYTSNGSVLKIGYPSDIFLSEYDLKIAADIADILNINYTTESVEPADLGVSLKNGEVDCILRFNRQEIENGIEVTGAYLESEYVIVVKEDSSWEGNEDFKDKSLGMADEYEVKKYVYSDFELKTEFSEYIIYEDPEKAFNDLRNGGIDALLVEKFIFRLFDKGEFVIAVENLKSLEYSIAFREKDKRMFREIDKLLN